MREDRSRPLIKVHALVLSLLAMEGTSAGSAADQVVKVG